MSAPLVEILYFKGCPNYEEARALNYEEARALVTQIGEELGISPEVRYIEVPDEKGAERERFLGSPTIRVNGRDIEPGAEARSEFVLACRVYRIDSGFRGQPHSRWLRDALQQLAGGGGRP